MFYLKTFMVLALAVSVASTVPLDFSPFAALTGAFYGFVPPNRLSARRFTRRPFFLTWFTVAIVFNLFVANFATR